MRAWTAWLVLALLASCASGKPDQSLGKLDLKGAGLRAAMLVQADLRRADLREADLSRAVLSEANLQRANLQHANLTGADLQQADLRGADLLGANLDGANVFYADFRGVKNLTGPQLRKAWWHPDHPPKVDPELLNAVRKGGKVPKYAERRRQP